MKKSISVIFILLAFLMTITSFFGFTKNTALAEENLSVKSKSAYLVDAATGSLIYAENENAKLPIASMCKIMTLLLCFEAQDDGFINANEKICISENAAGMGGSQVFLEANAEYLVDDLLKSIVVASANDACVALAEKICGSENAFVDKMNEKAQELGMVNTVFTNCTGLPKPGQHSTAKDVSIMFSELLKHKDYFKYSGIWMDKIEHPKGRITEISNTNKLIKFYNGCDGGKTGYTSEADHCLAASAIRNGMRLVCVVISSPDSKTRFNDVSTMFNYGFANYVNKLIVDDKKPLDISVDIVGGKQDTLSVIAEKPLFLFSQKNEKRSVEIDFQPLNRVKAPIFKGDLVGTLSVYENGIEIAVINVLANEDVMQKTYFDVVKDIGKKWAII